MTVNIIHQGSSGVKGGRECLLTGGEQAEKGSGLGSGSGGSRVTSHIRALPLIPHRQSSYLSRQKCVSVRSLACLDFGSVLYTLSGSPFHSPTVSQSRMITSHEVITDIYSYFIQLCDFESPPQLLHTSVFTQWAPKTCQTPWLPEGHLGEPPMPVRNARSARCGVM
jgi:hypothetical protein